MSELVSEVKLASGKESLTSGRTCPDCDETIREAKLIQTSLLPTQGFRNESVDIAFRFIPFSDVGGDFVDFFRLPDGFIGIYLGDVVGKGLSAAMFAALVMGTLRGIHKTGTDTARVLALLNERLAQRPIKGRFCSTLYALFNPARENSFSPMPGCHCPCWSPEPRAGNWARVACLRECSRAPLTDGTSCNSLREIAFCSRPMVFTNCATERESSSAPSK
jgi:hypothetical protein